ncbi:hypothetical protein MMUC44124_01865 [Mycolicibacterium mucogenicum DSM 44124]|uniref:Uncharacterized protein n=1 Tax=Mycolicibacterium mucogenicum DSM 44124 TaxID=1226753 RepID=A0A8H2JB07_MYCMU|nr:hypothetical protein MMUC44124_01865 [Mycolicibacterium mucogenicum DSM 44124]
MPAVAPRARGGSTSQAAARILLILDKLGEVPTPAEIAVFPSAVKVVRATSRLAKLDFWLRNPDYLANELLNDLEAGAIDAPICLGHVERMLKDEAPTLHLYPMQRYMYGAWELPDNAIALLKSHDLVNQRRVGEATADNSVRARRDYFLMEAGERVLANMRAEVDQLSWYDLQADAIDLLNIGPSGAAARARQYEQPEYAATPIGQIIPTILGQTRERLRRAAAAHGYNLDEPASEALSQIGEGK